MSSSSKVLCRPCGRIFCINLRWTCIHPGRVGMLIMYMVLWRGGHVRATGFWSTHLDSKHRLKLTLSMIFIIIIIVTLWRWTWTYNQCIIPQLFLYFILVQESKTGWNNNLCYWSCIVWYKTGTSRERTYYLFKKIILSAGIEHLSCSSLWADWLL